METTTLTFALTLAAPFATLLVTCVFVWYTYCNHGRLVNLAIAREANRDAWGIR